MCFNFIEYLSIIFDKMQRRVITTSFLLFGIYLESSAKSTIFCDFKDDSYHRSLYTCFATPSAPCNEECAGIVIEGNHLNGKTHEDVQGFVMENRNITKLPRYLDSVFPNILFISFTKTLIANITRSDMKQFPKLTSIRFSHNKVTGIYENIFEGLSLSHVEMDNNNLEYVTEDLTYPKTLGYLNFKNNKCVDMSASSPEDIDTLKDKILLRCSHSPRTKQLENNVMEIEKNDEQFDDRITKLEDVIQKLKEAMKNKFY